MIPFTYFDVGGVAITDFSGNDGWEELKRGIGIKPSFDKEFREIFDSYKQEICINRDVDTLMPIFSKKFGIKFPKNYSMLADFVNRFSKNISIWPAISAAKQRGKIGLLTNMYPGMLDAIKAKKLLPPTHWDVIIDSSVVKLAKPDPDLFRLAERKSGVDSKEILFVDNDKIIIEAAKKFGWQTFLYESANPGKSSYELLKLLNGGKEVPVMC